MTRSHSPLRPVLRSLAVAVTLAVGVSLAACSSGTATPSTAPSDSAAAGADGALRIGFSPFSMQVPAFIGLAEGLTHAAEASGDTVITADAKGDPSTQLQQIQQWVQLDQVDAIWVIPQSAEAVASAIQQAVDKGIVVLASGVPADYGMDEGAAGISFSNTDNVDYGTQIGDLTAQCITERLDGRGQIIFMQSPSGAQSTEEINDSIKAAVEAGAPDATFVNEQDAADRLGSAQIVSSALQAAPDANTVIATDDESSLGALDAFKAAGKNPADLCLIGAGGNEEAVAAVDSGDFYAEVAFDFIADLTQNLGELHALAADPSAPGQQLTIPIQVFTQE
ncbi:sugar ABC transporter substrate-binding protein [Microbacterium pygmaeum]|uniref:Monosaccharide ABC transporter substrate-binding protein, CUT2 family n=1 Tax=Microbacterium pygmaeum TaxID=370764 RepID=A0A1G7VKC1_9MICO|nr:sugar ABC transporter substrate-binding protein [Microbacterium pygmaeum]SDG60266.1 monosaccharide ABC transporter substrate-binding protein, CUT2 family [Microbacterium pygmaeum]